MNHPQADGPDTGHVHDHGHMHDHAHERAGQGLVVRLRHMLRLHSHETADQVDAAMEGSAEGLRTLWISLGVLGLTALIEAVVTALSGWHCWVTPCITRLMR